MGCIFFLISTIGFWNQLHKRTSIGLFYIPIITIALQFCALFLGGLLYVLEETAIVLFLIGLGFFAVDFYRTKGRFLGNFCTFGYGFLLVGFLILSFLVNGQKFSHYDNFSHWALVVKKLLDTNRFPNMWDTVIMFQHYPLGSSTFIYYFCRIAGSEESYFMLAQGFMSLCAILPICGCIRKNNGTSMAALCAMSGFFLCYNISIYDMLVDTLLPLVGTVTIFYCCDCCCLQKEPSKENLWMAALLMIWTVQIKHSGLLYAFLAACVIVVSTEKSWRKLLRVLPICCSSLLGFFLWDRHCANVYIDAAKSKHAMTAANYIRNFLGKNREYFAQIVQGVFRNIVEREENLWLLLWLVVLGVITFAFLKKERKHFLQMLGNLLIFSACYLIGVLGMYLFSMPLDEALQLGGLARYLRTMDITVYYVMLRYLLRLMEKGECPAKRKLVPMLLAALVLVTAVFGPVNYSYRYTVSYTTSPSRLALEETVETYGIQQGKTCFVCLPETDYGYSVHLLAYLLDAWSGFAVISDPEQLAEIQEYDVLINYDPENGLIQNWIFEHYPEHANEQVVFLAG